LLGFSPDDDVLRTTMTNQSRCGSYLLRRFIAVVLLACPWGAMADDVATASKQALQSVHSTARQVGQQASQAGKDFAERAKKVAKEISDAAKKSGHDVAVAAKKTSSDVAQASKDGVAAAKQTGQKIKTSVAEPAKHSSASTPTPSEKP
jgi:hypothetical protein